jgi:hypothetical protein
MDKQLANQVLATLENTANAIDGLRKARKIDPKVASSLVRDIDAFTDKFHVAAFGAAAHAAYRTKMAKVLQSDKDEPYMKTYDGPSKVISGEKDEPYMGTYDTDRTMTVTDRVEPKKPRELNQYAGGRSASEKTWAPTSRRASAPEKTWAP